MRSEEIRNDTIRYDMMRYDTMRCEANGEYWVRCKYLLNCLYLHLREYPQFIVAQIVETEKAGK